MRVERFDAVADIVGRRVRVSWEVALEPGEGLAAAPHVTLRRKERDFEFPSPGAADPFLVYDSATFPPAGATVTEVDLGEARVQDARVITTAASVARPIAGVATEVLRRTRAIAFDAARNPVRVRDEIIDVHDRAEGLEPGTTYYYELTGPGLAAAERASFRAVATPTEVHRSGRMMYELLPGIVRRHDVTPAPPRDTGAIPEAAPQSGQLRRFVDLFGTGLDHLRSRADELRGLHDVDDVDHRMLPFLASWLGWELSHEKPIPVQRHEIKYAAHLYRITGTIPGAVIWVKRLSGWDTQIKEFWRNVLFTNDLGNPGDPDDPGSRTVDTSDPAVLAAIGTVDDVVDYVTETGIGPDVHYATNVVGVFAAPEAGDSAADVLAKRARIVNGAGLFLPFNLRAVVVLETDTVERTADVNLGVSGSEDSTG